MPETMNGVQYDDLLLKPARSFQSSHRCAEIRYERLTLCDMPQSIPTLSSRQADYFVARRCMARSIGAWRHRAIIAVSVSRTIANNVLALRDDCGAGDRTRTDDILLGKVIRQSVVGVHACSL